MFAIIGKGQYSKEKLMDMLRDIGIIEPSPVVREIEKRGRAVINNLRILVIR